MDKKGSSRLDKGAHNLMEFFKGRMGDELHGFTRVGEYIAFYHEERLYSVYDKQRGTCTLVYAGSPYKAIEKVIDGHTKVVQNGTNNYNIQHVEELRI